MDDSVIMELFYEEKQHEPWLLFLPSYFRIYGDSVEAYFWLYRFIIPISEIEEVRIIEKIPWYVGWGLRIDLFRRKLYLAIHHGRSVEIKKRNGYWKSIVLSIKDPEKFISIVKMIVSG